MKSSIAPKLALLLFCCGALTAQVSSLDQARKATEQHPNSAEAQNALGEALDEAGQLQPARDAFARAVKLKSTFGQAYSNLGLVCLQMNDLSAAAANLDRAISLLGKSPDAGFALYLRAKIYTRQSENEKALEALNRAVVLRPDLAEAWSDLGTARKTLLDDSGALSAYQHAVDLKPDDPVAQGRLGSEYLRQDKPQQAAGHLQRAYEGNPKDQSTLNSLQTALRRAGKLEEADRVKAELAQLLAERDRASQNAVAAIKLNNEGATLEKSGDLAGAAKKYGQALELYPDHVGIRVNYAVALLRTGEWPEGLKQLREALRRDPANAQIQAALKDALAQAPPSAR
ncbi:MAG: tetratricopeptide repeat protein [Acidobacteriota bacterium]|nr:tetratricopeptide repeat protein [Acidobacteriota bacterium]